MTTLYLPYICHLTQYMWHYIHSISVIKPSVSIIPHPLFGWQHTQYIYDIIFSMHCLTWTLYDITPLYVWYHIHYIYDIIYNIYYIDHTAFMTTQRLYMTFQPLHLTSEPLYQCRDTLCIDWHHKYLSHHTWHTYDLIHIYMKSHWKFMISMLSIYDITTTAFMTSCLLYMKSHPRFMTSHPL